MFQQFAVTSLLVNFVTVGFFGSSMRPQSSNDVSTASQNPVAVHALDTPGVSAPIVVRQIAAIVTPAAFDAGVDGDVVIECTVNNDGHVMDPKVIQSLGYGLDEEATKAALQWRFQPATKDGIPVNVRVSLTFTFAMTGTPTNFEVRLAESRPAPGLLPAMIVSSHENVYVSASSLIANHDVVSARPIPSGDGTVFSVAVSLTPEGTERLATAAAVGKRLVILLNGRVMFVMAMNSENELVIPGRWMRRYAEGLAIDIVPSSKVRQ